MSSSINIDKVSVEFGYWATPRYEGEYPRISAGFAELKPDARYLPKYRTQPISDELGMLIDGHLQVMKRVTPELLWGSDNICIKKRKNLARKKCGEAPIYGALSFLGGKFMQKRKMARNGRK